MARGQVNTNNLNLGQWQIDEIERQALYIGVATKNVGSVMVVNSQSDLDEVLGVADSELKTQVQAGKSAGGENWQSVVAPQSTGYDLAEKLPTALEAHAVECVAICTSVGSKADVEAIYTMIEAQRTQNARRLFVYVAVAGIGDDQTWAEYITAIDAIQHDVKAERVGLVPQLHGNDLGLLMGRLCNRAFSVADSTMKTQGGAISGLGATPSDEDGVLLQEAQLIAISGKRFTTIQHYTDFPGVYWTDGVLLDAPSGDYQVVEHLRLVDKAARRIRMLQIQQIANRSFNNSVPSIESNTNVFLQPLRQMAKSVQVKGVVYPGEIERPTKGDVAIQWLGKYEVVVYFSITPVNSPKKLTANIALDLSGQ